MQSFSAEVGSRGYHVYRGNNWAKLVIHQPLQVSIETNAISRAYDSYCCKISVTRRVRIAAITFGNISGELSWFVYYFLHEGSPVRYCCQYTVPIFTYTRRRVANTNQNDIQSHFYTYSGKNAAAVSQLIKMDQVFCLEDEENPEEETKDINLDDDGDEGLMQGGGNSGEAWTSTKPVVIVIDDEQTVGKVKRKFEKKCKGRSMKH